MHCHNEREEISTYVSQISFSCCASATPYQVWLFWIAHRCFMIDEFYWWDGYLCLSLRIFLVFPVKKNDKDMNDKRLTKSYRATKLTLLCYAWRCSFKLQQIQSWETLFQRHPRHTSTNIHKHIVFVFFKKFSFFF